MADPAAGAGRAKPNKALKDFLDEVKVGFIEETFVVRGHKWLMRTPTPDEEAWADKYVQADSAMSFVSSQRISRLAISIKAIDGTPLEAMYDFPEDMDEDMRKAMKEPERKRYWAYSQLMASLAADVPPPVLRELWDKYDSLVKRQDVALSKVVEAGPNS